MAAPVPDRLSDAQFAATYGIPASIINDPKNKDVRNVLDWALAQRKAGKEPNDAVIANKLMGTNWYKNNLNSWIEKQVLRKSKSEGWWQAQVSSKAEEVKNSFIASGGEITDEQARQYAENLIYGSKYDPKTETFELFDQNWLNKTVADSINFGKTREVAGIQMYDLQGKAEDTSNKLYKMAQDYGLDTSMSNAAFTSWFEKSAKGLIDGTLAEQDVDDELIGFATSKFPGLASQFQRGLTLREAADPYLQTIASELEYDPNQLGLNDDLVQRVLNSTDDQGNFKPMSLYDAKLAARKDSRWQYTGKAKDEYTRMAQTILKDFGFLG